VDAVFLNLRIGALLYLAGLLVVSGQSSSQNIESAAPAAQVANPSAAQSLAQQQQSLFQQRQALIDQGATQEQLAAWHRQNASQFAALRQQAQSLSNTAALQLRPTNHQPNIPANASPALKDFLTAQASLANARAQIHNQLVQAMPANATSDQVRKLQKQEREAFQKQHGADLQTQRQKALALAHDSPSAVPSLPPTLSIPADASPQLAAFLTTRDQVMRSEIQLQNQYATADAATRHAAMKQWRQQNAALLQQMQQQAKTLSQESTTTPAS